MKTIVRRNKKGRRSPIRAVAYGVLAAALLIGGVNLYLVLNTEQVLRRVQLLLEDHLAVPFGIGRIEYSFTGGITLHEFYVESPYGARFPRVLEVDSVAIRLSPIGILTRGNPVARIEVADPRVFLELDDGGSLTLAHVLRDKMREKPALPDRLPAVEMRNLRVDVDPDSIFPLEALTIPHFDIEIPSSAPGDFALAASLRHPDAGSISLNGRGNARRGDLTGSIDVARLRIDDHLRAMLPAENVPYWEEFNPKGVANLSIEVKLARNAKPKWRARLTILEGSLDLRTPPMTIESLSGAVDVSDQRIEIHEPLRGMVWRSDAALKAGSLDFESGALDFELEIAEVPLEAESRKLLEHEALAEVRKLWDDLSPRGSMGVKVHGRGNAFKIDDLDLSLALRHLSMSHSAFPYELSGLNGGLELKDDLVTLALAGGSDVTVDIRCETVATALGRFDLSVKCTGLPLDQRLVQAGPPALEDFFREYRPEGRINTAFFLRRSGAGEPLVSTLQIASESASLSFRAFPYRVEEIRGTTLLELMPNGKGLGRIEFGEIEGRHGDAAIRLEGGEIVLSKEGPPHIDMAIRCDDFPIDESLYDALTPDARAVVRSFGFDGKIAAKLAIRNEFVAGGAEGPVEVVFEAAVRADSPLKVSYAPLPYPLVFRRGTLRLDLSHDLYHILDFVADESAGPGVRVDGVFSNDSTNPTRKLLNLKLELGAGKQGDVAVPGLNLTDPVLVASLPAELRNFIEQLQLDGFVQGSVLVNYSYLPNAEGAAAQQQVDYTADLSCYDCAVNVGVKFSQLFAKIEVEGRFAPDHPHSFQCTANVKECRLSRFRPRNVELVVSYGEPHRAILLARNGRFECANPIAVEGETAVELFTLGEPFTSRLGAGNLENVLQIYIRRGDLYGGAVEGFAFADLGWKKDFYVHVQSCSVDLAKGAADLFPDEGETKGIGSGFVKFGGNLAAPESLGGDGHLVIRDGKLRDIGGVGTILRPLQDSEDNRYISSVDCRFRIGGGRFRVRNVFDEAGNPFFELKTKGGLRLLGTGYMDFQQNIKADFRAEVFKTGFGPIDKPIMSLLPADTVHVEGLLDRPEVTWKPLW